MTLFLIWLVIALSSLHMLNIILHKYILSDFYIWKENKIKDYSNYHYLVGTLFGLLLGPFVLVLVIGKLLTKDKK